MSSFSPILCFYAERTVLYVPVIVDMARVVEMLRISLYIEQLHRGGLGCGVTFFRNDDFTNLVNINCWTKLELILLLNFIWSFFFFFFFLGGGGGGGVGELMFGGGNPRASPQV